MAFELTKSFVEQFDAAFTPFLRQSGSRLMSAVSNIPVTGVMHHIRQRDVGDAFWDNSSSATTKYAPIRYDTRILKPRAFSCNLEIRDADIVAQGNPDPSQLAEQAADSCGIFLDRIILNALGGGARTDDRATPIELPETQLIVCDDNELQENEANTTSPGITRVALNTGKLAKAVRMLRASHARGPLICVGSEFAMSTLRADPRAASSLFNTQPSLASGMNTPYAGVSAFIPVESEIIGKSKACTESKYSKTDVEYAYVYAMDHVMLGCSAPMSIKQAVNAERNLNTVLKCWGMYDAVRVFETAVVKIEVARQVVSTTTGS